MPVAAVAMSAATFASGAAAFAATGSFASGLVMAGSALSMVGTVSGNNKLAALGGVLTLGAGASGGFGNPLDLGKGATAATEGVGATVADAAQSAAGMDRVAQSLSNFDPVTKGLGTGTSSIGSVDGTSFMARAKQAASPITSSVADGDAASINEFLSAGKDLTQNATLPGQVASSSAPFQATAQSPFSGSDGASTMTANGKLETAPPQAVPASNQGSGGMAQQALAWAKANPELAKIALQGAAGFAGNLFPSDKDKAMAEAYRQQAATSAQKARWATGRI